MHKHCHGIYMGSVFDNTRCSMPVYCQDQLLIVVVKSLGCETTVGVDYKIVFPSSGPEPCQQCGSCVWYVTESFEGFVNLQ
jgi:hypothetical protein